MYSSKIVVCSFLFAVTFLSSCNYFTIEKVDRNEIKEAQLKEIKNKSLENYPEIYNCTSSEDPKTCFERQLNEHLGNQLAGVVVDEDEITKDTIWLTINVSNTGVLSLNPMENVTEEYQELYNTIHESLKDISPIKPAHINGVTVNCNFKLPLVIKKLE